MKKIILYFILILSSCYTMGQSQNIMSGKYSVQDLQNLLIAQDKWTPFPKITDRESWAKADQEMMNGYIKQAEEHLDYNWPTIPAVNSLLIVRTGNRYEYQKISGERRYVLCTMLLAEIAENKGRFIDQIINGVWAICEESWWGASAHLPKSQDYQGLMDVTKPFVDLHSAETGTYLAWVDYFLGEQLDKVSPQIRKRIYNEVNYRLLQPLMNKPHFWMQKNAYGRAPNNWNPWICSNWINFTLLLEKDQEMRAQMIAKSLIVLDEFVNPYPLDGGCDEGPGYWGAAAASLYDNLSMLNLASNNAFEHVFADEKIKNMGRFIYRVQISENYFLNFADAGPKPHMHANMMYRYGKDINDQKLMEFGAYYAKGGAVKTSAGHFFRTLFALFNQEEIRNTPKNIPLIKDVWLPNLEVMAARDKDGSSEGFYIAAKGGTNDESHNHNDIGSYIIYYDGDPLIIDIGNGTYTARTFGKHRYDIWNNCSNYHNLPSINGNNQSSGHLYTASEVTYKANKSSAEFSLDLAKAYNTDAGINSWKRTIKLNRGKNVQITDNCNLKEATQIAEHMMTCYPCNIYKDGEVTVHYKNQNGVTKDFVIQYNPLQMKASVEKMKLETPEDVGVERNWGDVIHRINFSALNLRTKDSYSFTIGQKN